MFLDATKFIGAYVINKLNLYAGAVIQTDVIVTVRATNNIVKHLTYAVGKAQVPMKEIHEVICDGYIDSHFGVYLYEDEMKSATSVREEINYYVSDLTAINVYNSTCVFMHTIWIPV